MNYSVLWISDAENELAFNWVVSSDRNAVTRAAHKVDEQLRKNPLQTGESRQSSLH